MSPRPMKPAVARKPAAAPPAVSQKALHPVAARAAAAEARQQWNVRLPKSLLEEIEERCWEERVTQQVLAERAVRFYLENAPVTR